MEADLCRFYDVDLVDFYRGTLSARKLGVLIRHLPADSALVRALCDGRPPWSTTDTLLADLWALTARANSEEGSLPDDFDHPLRAEMTAKAKLQRKRELKVFYLHRKAARRRSEGMS